MKCRLCLCATLFALAVPLIAQEFSLGGERFIVSIPANYEYSIKKERSIFWSMMLEDGRADLVISFNPYSRILDDPPMTRSELLTDLIQQKGGITEGDVLALFESESGLILIPPASDYYRRLFTDQIKRSDDVWIEYIMQLSISGDGYLTGPFLLLGTIPGRFGYWRVDLIYFNKDEEAFESMLSRYGKVKDGALKYENQAQLDRLSKDILKNDPKAYPDFVTIYLDFIQILNSLREK